MSLFRPLLARLVIAAVVALRCGALQVYAEIDRAGAANFKEEPDGDPPGIGVPAPAASSSSPSHRPAFDDYLLFLEFQEHKEAFFKWRQTKQELALSSTVDDPVAAEVGEVDNVTNVTHVNVTQNIIVKDPEDRPYLFTVLPYATILLIVACCGWRCFGTSIWYIIRRDVSALYRALGGGARHEEADEASSSSLFTSPKAATRQRRMLRSQAIKERGIRKPPTMLFQVPWEALPAGIRKVLEEVFDDPSDDWAQIMKIHGGQWSAEDRDHFDYWWESLSEEKQESLAKIGFSEHQWNKGCGGHLMHTKRWSDLGSFVQIVASSRLGVKNADAWDNRTAQVFHTEFHNLTADQEKALDELGWPATHWQPDPQWMPAAPLRFSVRDTLESWFHAFVEMLKDSASVLISIYFVLCLIGMGILKPFLQQVMIYGFLVLIVAAALIAALTEMFAGLRHLFNGAVADLKLVASQVRAIWVALHKMKTCKQCSRKVGQRFACLPCGAEV